MALFPQEALNDGVRKREVFGWAMYDFANSGYTTVVLTAVFNTYFVGVAAGGAPWATLAWTMVIAAASLVVMLTMPGIGAHADLHACKKRLLAYSTAACVLATAALALVGRGDLWLAVAAMVVSNVCYSYGESLTAAFLPHVESGLFTFIGATTENPSFEVNSALLSRATVHVLKPLSDADLQALIARAQALLRAAPMDAAATQRLIGYADGDARRLLNAYENLAQMAGSAAQIDEPLLERSLGEQLRRYDKGGEQFYDTISALHKAVRGSDPDAALYWFVRMLDGGVDPRYAARRLVRMANEDIGLADPRALRLALDATETYERLGSPEGELALAEAVVYLAVAPKSNAVYAAYKAARAFVAADGTRAVPLHLRNAPTRLMKTLDYGKGYRYAHDEEGAFAAGERYWPDDLEAPPSFYRPVPRGLEIRIGEKLDELRRLNEEAKKAR